jgi:hypothetical protein
LKRNSSIEAQIEGADAESATFLWTYLAHRDIGINQKHGVQNVLIPSGLKFHAERGILNSDNDSLFNSLQEFVGGKAFMARPERFELPT